MDLFNREGKVCEEKDAMLNIAFTRPTTGDGAVGAVVVMMIIMVVVVVTGYNGSGCVDGSYGEDRRDYREGDGGGGVMSMFMVVVVVTVFCCW